MHKLTRQLRDAAAKQQAGHIPAESYLPMPYQPCPTHPGAAAAPNPLSRLTP